ncbi:hypothetical protein NLL53_27565, partial [Klebsiella pneumoniae]|nr:hypothetical protein [Klebsiella pneumoniae]
GNLNDILIAQFKKGFDLTDTQTALVQSIFFLGYFFVALPAAARLACGEPLQAAARFAAAYAAVSVEKQGASSLPEYLEAQER